MTKDFKGKECNWQLWMQAFIITSPTLHLIAVRNNNQVIETYDYVKNETSVNEDDAHGMNVFQ